MSSSSGRAHRQGCSAPHREAGSDLCISWILSSGRSFDAELRHLRLQRCPLHAEPRGGAGWAADKPVRLLESLTNVLALRVFERRKIPRVAIAAGAALFEL